MSDLREEVWGWIVEEASDFSASTLNTSGFGLLTRRQRESLAAKYMADLGADGDSVVYAQGQKPPL